MTVRELQEKLAEYPDTMTLRVRIEYPGAIEEIDEYESFNITEDPEVPNTVIIKI